MGHVEKDVGAGDGELRRRVLLFYGENGRGGGGISVHTE